jgi:hypothetical protein
MWLAKALVKSLADHPPIPMDDAADHRIRLDIPASIDRKRKGLLHQLDLTRAGLVAVAHRQ